MVVAGKPRSQCVPAISRAATLGPRELPAALAVRDRRAAGAVPHALLCMAAAGAGAAPAAGLAPAAHGRPRRPLRRAPDLLRDHARHAAGRALGPDAGGLRLAGRAVL